MIIPFRPQTTVVIGPRRELRRRAERYLRQQGFPVLGPGDVAFTGYRTAGVRPADVAVLVTPRDRDWDLAGRCCPDARILLVTEDRAGRDAFVEAVMAGADAVLDAAVSPGELADAVRALVARGSYLTPLQATWLLEAARAGVDVRAGDGPLCVA